MYVYKEMCMFCERHKLKKDAEQQPHKQTHNFFFYLGLI